MSTFEDNYELINIALEQHRHKWFNKAVNWMDYDDVKQTILLHIKEKFHKWDQTRPINPWLHRIIHNQIVNILRNVWSGMSRPCLRCPDQIDEEGCSIYLKQCAKCPLYSKWEKTKKKKADVHLPVSLENHTDLISDTPSYELNFERAIPILNKRLKLVLKPYEWQFYDLMYIQNKSEKEIIQIMEFKNTEKKASHRYKRMQQIQKSVMDKAREILMEKGIED